MGQTCYFLLFFSNMHGSPRRPRFLRSPGVKLAGAVRTPVLSRGEALRSGPTRGLSLCRWPLPLWRGRAESHNACGDLGAKPAPCYYTPHRGSLEDGANGSSPGQGP